MTAGLIQDYSNCAHLRWWKAGYDRAGRRRLKCAFCGARRGEEERLRISPQDALKAILPRYLAGTPPRVAAREIGIDRWTVGKYYKFFRGLRGGKCRCGKSRVGHSGRCLQDQVTPRAMKAREWRERKRRRARGIIPMHRRSMTAGSR